MADIAKSGTPSLCSVLPGQDKTISGLLAGEAIGACDACYIKAADGKVYLSDGSAADALAKVRGFSAKAAAIGEAVTLVFDVNFRYGAGMTPGADIFLSVNPGAIADAASTGGSAPIGFVVDATRIRVWQSRY